MAMCNCLELMIALKFAELDDVAAHLKPCSASLRSHAQSHPDEWAEQLAQLANLWEFGTSLPAEFASFVHGPN
jgi:hypothetical protein